MGANSARERRAVEAIRSGDRVVHADHIQLRSEHSWDRRFVVFETTLGRNPKTTMSMYRTTRHFPHKKMHELDVPSSVVMEKLASGNKFVIATNSEVFTFQVEDSLQKKRWMNVLRSAGMKFDGPAQKKIDELLDTGSDESGDELKFFEPLKFDPKSQCSIGSSVESQPWRECYTCLLRGKKRVCTACSEICHRGHKLSGEVRSSGFVCHCGLKGPQSCKALPPENSWKAPNKASKEEIFSDDEDYVHIPSPKNLQRQRSISQPTLAEAKQKLQKSLLFAPHSNPPSSRYSPNKKPPHHAHSKSTGHLKIVNTPEVQDLIFQAEQLGFEREQILECVSTVELLGNVVTLNVLLDTLATSKPPNKLSQSQTSRPRPLDPLSGTIAVLDNDNDEMSVAGNNQPNNKIEISTPTSAPKIRDEETPKGLKLTPEIIKLKNELEKLQNVERIRTSCRKCVSGYVSGLILDCAHLVLCYDCATKLLYKNKKCPVCKKRIRQVVRTYEC